MCDRSLTELQETLVVARTVAAMSRNLPSATTLFLGSNADTAGECFPAGNEGCTEHLVPAGLRTMFSMAMESMQCMDQEGPEGKLKRGTHASVARVSLGLLSDLTANDEAVRAILQSVPDKGKAWHGGVYWGGAA